MKPLTDIVTNEKVGKALHYLATTDEDYAKAKGLMDGLKKQEDTILAMEYLAQPSDKGVSDRNKAALTAQAYTVWREKYEQAVIDYELYRNKRATAETIIEVWRSLNANRRTGNV